MSQDLKSVIQETAHFLLTTSSSLSLYSYYKSNYLYFDGTRNNEKSDGVRLYGVCVVSSEFHPQMYISLSGFLSKVACSMGLPPKVLRALLAIQTEGSASIGNSGFSYDAFPEDYSTHCSFDVLLDRAGQYITVIWQALVSGKSVAVYSPDLAILQAVAAPISYFCYPGKRQLIPLVLEKSMAQTSAALDTPLSIWCTCDSSILNGRFDLIVDLSTRSVKYSSSFSKEAGKSSLLESLMETINDTTAAEGNVANAISNFNKVILDTLKQIKLKTGELNHQTIGTTSLPSDKKMILTGMATSGVFQV